MKNSILYTLAFILLAFAGSCDDSFLDENKKQIDGYNLDVPLLVQPLSEFTEVSVTLPDLKNKDFNVLQYPKMIHFESFKGHIDETGNLAFRIKVDDFDSWVSLVPQELGRIVLNIENFGLLSIPVLHLNVGVPNASISKTVIDFGTSRIDKNVEIENWANGYLWYKLTKKPSWVDIKASATLDDFFELDSVRIIEPNSFMRLSIYPQVKDLEPGEHEDEIIIETSDSQNPTFTIKVKIDVLSYENPESMLSIDGKVIDSEFDKDKSTLYVLTQNPNKLIKYNIETQEKVELSFNKNVNCISFSEDKTISFVGMSEEITKINMRTFSIKDTYPVNFNVHDIVYDEESTIYITYHSSGYVGDEKIYKLDLNSGEYTLFQIIHIYANTNMVKIKGKPEFFASRETISPNGVIWIDFSSGEPKLKRYWHTSLGNRISFSENQQYIYAHDGQVYKSPSQNTGDHLNEVGRLKLDNINMYYSYLCYSDNPESNAIWASYNKNDWQYKNVVVEFDNATYQKKREINLNDYVAIHNGKKDYYKTLAHYIFTDYEGSKLILIKNIDEINANAWHLEVIDVTK